MSSQKLHSALLNWADVVLTTIVILRQIADQTISKLAENPPPIVTNYDKQLMTFQFMYVWGHFISYFIPFCLFVTFY